MDPARTSRELPPILLPVELGIGAAPTLQRMFLDIDTTSSDTTDMPRSCTIDGSAVARVSTAAIQVLLAAGRHFADRGWQLRLVTPSPELAQAIDDLGLADAFAPCGDADA
ncbi:MAG: STAS domain-containing protein [Pseudomonadota bacterium]